jgi:hypothetical protein
VFFVGRAYQQDSAIGHRFPTIIPEAARWDAERQA